ncbi:fam-h protein [Plasmodium relictum]|uniref:Fam-h protein n=1 Tax=Plasmodium relictum TaxID=85471 RepID=A0A1J1GKP0_PLARL|nr:fam-h protein [Plasmodium relictum]CRG85640.1 fam-h protein [Plasmodium relictum]
MNSKSNAILNFSTYYECYSHIYKDLITINMSALKIYDKKQEKNILNFLINFFIFILLIFILQCSNNRDSLRSCNYKNDLKSILYLGAKRSLVEGNNTINEINEELEHCEQMVKGANLKLDNKINEVENNSYVKPKNKKNCTDIEVNNINTTEVEVGKEIKTNEKNKKGIFPKNFLILKDKYETIAAYFIIFLIFCILLSLIIGLFSNNTNVHDLLMVFFCLLCLILIILIFYEKRKKEEQKIYYKQLIELAINYL